MNQGEFAGAIGMAPAAVSRWEAGEREPSRDAYIQMLLIAEDPRHQEELLVRSGLTTQELGRLAQFVKVSRSEIERRAPEPVRIPLYKDLIAGGPARMINDKDIEEFISIPKEWLPTGSRSGKGLVAVRVVGDSMAPILLPDYIVLIDISVREPKKLVNKMVAVREDEGVTVKWLRREEGEWRLVPQNTSLRHPTRTLRERDEEKWGIVGEVVKWIGQPPQPRGRR